MTSPLPDPLPLRGRNVPRCYVCGSLGRTLYVDIADRLFSAPGRWSVARCSDPTCGLLWLDPMPIEEDIGNAYARYFTHGNADTDANVGGLRSEIRQASVARDFGYPNRDCSTKARLLAGALSLHPLIRDEMGFSVMWQPAVPGGRLLDVGCGSGILIERLRRLGWNAEGVDFDPAAAQVGAGKGLTIRVGGIADQQYPSDTFDAVTMSHFIEHVHEPTAVLREALRVLKPGGRLSLVTPNAAGLCHRWFGAAWLPLDPPRHLHVFTAAALLRLTREAGFVEAEARTMLSDVYGVVVGSMHIRRRGRFEMGAPLCRTDRFVARLVQLVEAIVRPFDPTVGDELTITARKPIDARADGKAV